MKIDDHETTGHLFDGDKFFFIRKRNFKFEDTGETFPALILDVWHSAKKYQPGEEKHEEARAGGYTQPAFAMIFKHKQSLVVMKEIFEKMIERFDSLTKEEKKDEIPSETTDQNP